MTTKVLTIVSLLICSLSSRAQTFTLINIDTLTIDEVGSAPSCDANLQNNSNMDIDIDIIRLVNDTAPNWETFICSDICYPPQVDSIRYTVAANTTGGCSITFLSDTLPDTSRTYYMFRNVANPANVFYQDYYGITMVNAGMNEAVKQEVNTTIYPSPAATGIPFTFSITNTKGGAKNYSLRLCDLAGKTVAVMQELNTGSNKLILQLRPGIYFYTLQDGNKAVAQGKIALHD